MGGGGGGGEKECFADHLARSNTTPPTRAAYDIVQLLRYE